MKWIVYRYNINRRKIETYNIFEHSSFYKDTILNLKNSKSKDEFAEQLWKDLMYYFWSKMEWEVAVFPWTCTQPEYAKKIDVYEQVVNNFEVFANYVWSFKNEKME